MATTLNVKSIDIHGIEENERGDHRTHITVHFEISSGLGQHQIAVQTTDYGVDNGILQARKLVAAWAASVAREAQ